MVQAEALRHFIDATRARVDAALDRRLPRPPACPPLLSEAIRYSVMAGGKRLRPILVLAAADAVDRAGSARGTDLALPAACAVEFIHTYSLIHDDLPAMDNDTLRRGRPTLHVVYGDGIAILAGDALQADAFALLAGEPDTADPEILARKIAATRVIAEASGGAGMVGGQAIDLQAAGLVPAHPIVHSADTLRAMHVRKTGALIRASAMSGAIMAGGSPEIVSAIGQWAAEIGLAFQIVDDVLDIEGNAAQLGKTAGKDAAGDKPTYPSLFGLEEAKRMAAHCVERARAILREATLDDSWLDGIASWVVSRRN